MNAVRHGAWRGVVRAGGAALGLLMGSVLPSAAAAQEGMTLLRPEASPLIWTLVTYLLVFAVLWRFAWPKLLAAVEAREAVVRETLAAAEAERGAAAALQAEARREVEEARARARRILETSRSMAEHQREEILAQARYEAEALVARAQREAARLVERAAIEVSQATRGA